VKAAMADLRFKGRILPLALDESSAAQINPDLAELQSLNGRVTANLGEKIGDDILAREKKLRSTVVVESPK
jgi:hypothetical protein